MNNDTVDEWVGVGVLVVVACLIFWGGWQAHRITHPKPIPPGNHDTISGDEVGSLALRDWYQEGRRQGRIEAEWEARQAGLVVTREGFTVIAPDGGSVSAWVYARGDKFGRKYFNVCDSVGVLIRYGDGREEAQ